MRRPGGLVAADNEPVEVSLAELEAARPLRPTVRDTRPEMPQALLDATTADIDVDLLHQGFLRMVKAEGGEIVDLHITRPTLEDVFIELTGRRIRE